MNRNKQRGTAWESEIVAFLHRAGVEFAERRALGGAKDRGDVAGIPGVVVEAKNCRTIELGPWLNEAHTEAENDGAELGVVWIKRRGRALADHGFVVMDGAAFVKLLRAAGYIPEATR